MIIHENSKIIKVNPREITKEEIFLPKGFDSIRSSIFEVDGKYYYPKIVDTKKMINELLGTYFSKMIGLDAVDYQLGIHNNQLYILSEVFYNPEFTYSHCYNLYDTNAINMYYKKRQFFEKYYLNYFKMFDKITNPNMLTQLLKLIAVDLKMGQTDRGDRNLILKTKNETNDTDLAPIYDFSDSYEENPTQSEKYYYDNSFVILRKNFFSLFMFCQKNPEILDYLKILCNISTNQVLEEIENDKQIIISDYEKHYYEEKDNEYTNVLKRII